MVSEPMHESAAQGLLRVIRGAAPEWITRQQISEAIGRRRITPYDIATLDRLVQDQVIEARQAQRGAFGKRWEYRAKG